MTKTNFIFGDIFLIKFPFTDISGAKKRPALLIYGTNDNDVILCRITSQARDTEFDVDIKDWQQSGLRLPSIIRLHKIATLESTLIDKKLGTLSSGDMQNLKNRMKEIMAKSL